MTLSYDKPPLWDALDGIFVINLDHREDRWMEFQATFSKFIPPDKLQRISALWGKDLPGYGKAPWFRGRKRDATWAARAGCIFSHRKAIQAAKAAGWNTFLILEDDVTPAIALAELETCLGATLRLKSTHWDICYLGYTDPTGPFRTLAPLSDSHHLAQIFGSNCTHAYLLHGPISDWILKNLPDEASLWQWLARNRAIDRWYRRRLGCRFRVVAVSPAVINQSDGFSDITERAADLTVHRRFVPQCKSAYSYHLRLAARCVANGLANQYDRFRSTGKKRQGF